MSRTECASGIGWCAGGHRCSRMLGVHRSDPQTWHTGYGMLVVTRVRRGGRDRLELLATVNLPADELRSRDLARHLAVGVDLAVRAGLAGYRRWIRVLYHRLAGTR